MFEKLMSSPVSYLDEYLSRGGDPDLIEEEGATLLFHAVLLAKEDHIRALIRHGCNVNYTINETLSAHFVLAETPLSLAQQCAFLMDNEKYGPVVQLLIEAGACET